MLTYSGESVICYDVNFQSGGEEEYGICSGIRNSPLDRGPLRPKTFKYLIYNGSDVKFINGFAGDKKAVENGTVQQINA